MIVIVVILSFCRESGHSAKKSYSSLPERGGIIETVHLEEEESMDL